MVFKDKFKKDYWTHFELMSDNERTLFRNLGCKVGDFGTKWSKGWRKWTFSGFIVGATIVGHETIIYKHFDEEGIFLRCGQSIADCAFRMYDNLNPKIKIEYIVPPDPHSTPQGNGEHISEYVRRGDLITSKIEERILFGDYKMLR